MQSRLLHHGRERLFKTGIWLKGINGGLELLIGLVLSVVPGSSLRRSLLHWVPPEAGFGPTDWMLRELSRALLALSGAPAFAIFYLLSHGVVKVFLAGALLRGIGWAYPTALTVFGLLAGYEICRFIVHPGVLMGLIVTVDAAVIALIGSHWRAERQGMGRSHAPA